MDNFLHVYNTLAYPNPYANETARSLPGDISLYLNWYVNVPTEITLPIAINDTKNVPIASMMKNTKIARFSLIVLRNLNVEDLVELFELSKGVVRSSSIVIV